MTARVRSIAPGAPFLRTLVASCIDGSLGIAFPSDGRDYSSATIYVPTRRAARALGHAFAEALQPRAVLLPRIVPLGDPADLEERAILTGDGLGEHDDIVPAIGDLERRLLLTPLIEAWRASGDMEKLAKSGDGFSIGGGFPDSFALAGDLSALIDEFAIEGIDWHRIKTLTDGQFDVYWSMTRSFLEIAGEAWPQKLAAMGQLDPAERVNRLLLAEAGRLKHQKPMHPVIAAGSTGTVPATATLLAAIARLPNGVVVLPGLDRQMDANGWKLVADHPQPSDAQPGHPQAALKRLLSHLGIERDSVEEVGAPQPELRARAAVINASARAAGATDDWPALRTALESQITAGLEGLSVIEAPDERMEALAIAVALREVLETPEKTAALVTPDRALAQRVSLELKRWGITADDSSGTALAVSPMGAFARLTAEAVKADFSSVATIAVLTHACVLSGEGSEQKLTAVNSLEIAGLRGADRLQGLAGLAGVLDDAEQRIADYRSPPPLRRTTPEMLEAARAVLAGFVEAFAELETLARKPQAISVFARAHLAVIEALCGERASTGADAISLAKAFDDIAAASADPVIAFADYAALLDMLLAEQVIAPSQPVQGRIKIWGLLEARLMESDRIVLGGLNEGVWPPDVRTDPFLNRAMRAELGLSSPERRIGQSAHDFAQALGAPEAIIARALTVEGTPMVASRFLRRLDAFVGKSQAKALRDRGKWFAEAAIDLDRSIPADPAPRPDPKPIAAIQPISLSVTEIGTLTRDPYAIYARHILKLAPLEPLDQQVDARDRGNIIHDALARFVAATAEEWPADPLDLLLTIGREGFAPFARIESVSAFWWPVFEKTAIWFVGWEEQRRAGVRASAVEASGSITFPLADGTPFRLRGRADRIDTLTDGSLAIIDYKSGAPPSGPQVERGLEPQLTLMAALAAKGMFDGVEAAPVSSISYVKVGSSPNEVGVQIEKKTVTAEQIDTMASRHIEGLKTALDRLRGGQDGYLSRRMPERVRDGGDYDHLARVKEWMAEVGD